MTGQPRSRTTLYRWLFFVIASFLTSHPALAGNFSQWNSSANGSLQWSGYTEIDQRYSAEDIDRETPQIFSTAGFALDSRYGQLFYGLDSNPDHSVFASRWSGRQLILGFQAGAADGKPAKLAGFSDVYGMGFDSAESSWRHLTAGWSMSDSLELTAGATDIKLAGRTDAGVYQTGFHTDHWTGHLAQIQRSGDKLARHARLAYETPVAAISYTELSDTGGHRLSSLQASTAMGKNSAAGLSFQFGTSPLTGLNDQRVMLQWVYAPDNRTPSQPTMQLQNRALNFMKNMLIAGGIVAGAVAIASSSGKADGAEGGFTSTRDAARAALNKVNPSSVRENREYGGWVYQAKGDSYSYTPAQSGTIDKVSLGPKPDVTQASYHTHGAPNTGYDGEHFSSSDIRSDNQQGVDGYLGTPLGKFLYYNRSSGQISQVGTIATR